MKNLLITILLMTSLLGISLAAEQERDPRYVSLERSPVLLQLMEDIDISVEAAGAFRFNERESIVRSHPQMKFLTKREVMNQFFSQVQFEYFNYSAEQIKDVKKRFSLMIGEPLENGKFQVIISSDIVPYYDVEFTAVKGKDYFFTYEFAFEN